MSLYTTDKPLSFWWQLKTGFACQRSVILALIFKEFKIRLGDSRLGLLWVLLEPIVSMIMISAIWLYIGREKIDGVHTMLFIGSGFVVFIIIQRGYSLIAKAIVSNPSLLNYPQVKPIDTVLARFILEMSLHSIAALLLFFTLWWFLDISPTFANPLMMIGAIAIAMMISLGLGLSLAIYGTFYPGLMKSVELVTRPLMLLSAILYSMRDIPPVAREVLAWNPIIHIIEYFRAGAFGVKLFAGHNVMYPLMLGIILLGFSFVAYYANRYKLIQK